MEQVLNTLLPVFVVIALGLVLAKRKFISPNMFEELNRLIFRVCLPALIVHSLATASSFPSGTGPIVFIFLLATMIVVALSLLASRLLRLQRQKIGTFVQGAFRGNLAYTGLPILIFAMQGRPDEVLGAVVAQAMFVLAPSMLVYNAMAVLLLVGSHEKSFLSNLPKVLYQVATNPLIIASAVGVLLFLLPFELPAFVLNSLELTGQIAAPAALICVGGGMAFFSMQGRYRSACVATVLKVVILPLIAFALAAAFGIDSTARLVLLVFSACPTAVASYIMAKELKGDEALAAGAIIISTAACIPTLALIIAFA